MIKPNPVLIYTDGACLGNPGPGGWGAVVSAKNKVWELGGAAQSTTNNRMELTACIEALRRTHSKELNTAVVVTDSLYVLKGITEWIFKWKQNGWRSSSGKEVLNQDLWQRLDQACSLWAGGIKWAHCRGHRGVEANERCDTIGGAFARGESIDLLNTTTAAYPWKVEWPAPC